MRSHTAIAVRKFAHETLIASRGCGSDAREQRRRGDGSCQPLNVAARVVGTSVELAGCGDEVDQPNVLIIEHPSNR